MPMSDSTRRMLDPACRTIEMHNERVAAVFIRLFDICGSDDAYTWMISYCPPLKGKPIDMIDDDERYQRLLAAVESLESGEPRS